MNYVIYTDGSCWPNPGHGSWAYVILNINQKIIHQASGYVKNTTNNRMELQAIIEALNYIKSLNNLINHIQIYTDSQLITKWNSKGKGKKNKDLIQKLIAFNTQFKGIKYEWIKGHSGIKWNEFVDSLAETTREAYSK